MRIADRTRVSFFVALTVALLLTGLPRASRAADESQQIVVHLSHFTDDLHSVSMALELGATLAGAGAEVTLFADLEGVRLGDSRVPQNLRWGSGKAVSVLYEAFVSAGGSIVLCPHCARAAGIGPEQLRKGSRIGTKDEIAALFLAAEKILDY